MSYSIIPTLRFEKELKRLAKKFPSLKNEFAQLITDITENPEAGTFIGNNCYKIRLAIGSKGKGKSGGARVITYLYIEAETVYLLTIYDKGEKADLKPNELAEMIESLELN
ncbi:MAG: type II toxin-antitoxin system RelE/ParE family toxin [Saprospiraceae bacterium]|jgi:mRNA-degrading endonuclease RelE of RelBE toxin-antitoxin system|nr:type II toxin-antitoxin system RelE/ParE family toxin [Saprospiraceae bacterium]MBK7794850.1 type II toxin-antitoxin system RelE/ParE family toxin [Saprospiraceae bacterium]MBL0261319.1 type II toxin-antitoxin system RelE/ParE family toxin [Saprospiraceae bacterium]